MMVEVAVSERGLTAVFVDEIDEGVVVQRAFSITPDALSPDQATQIAEFMDVVDGWVKAAQRDQSPGPYDNPEEEAQWGTDDD